MYKDFLYYDDESEYLKRYYRLDESFPRIQNLSKFYSNTSEGLAKPNLAVHEQNKIILKRNNKLHKYYLNKLQNFADIPQTQRNPHPDDDFRILNNLHDDEGYSEDLYNHQHRQRHTNEERYAEGQHHHENEGGVHNSFQQMLERYEEATAKVSFESNEHDMYDPQDSTGSPKAGNKSEAEENITFDEKSIEFSSKLHEKDFLLERQAFMSSRHSELIEEKIHDVHRENEDQIPHNLSNFALSDASDLHIINDMIRSTTDDNLAGTLTNNYFKEPIHVHVEKVKPHHAHDRQKENEEGEKEKNKAALLHAQKSHSTKSKSTSTHVPIKQSEAASKKMKIPLEKAKTLKEPESAPVHTEKPLKSIERNVYPKDQHTERTGIQAFVSSKREKEEVILDKSQRSTRNADVFDKMSPRDLQYPALSMKNVPINQIKAVENGKKHTEIKVTATPYDDKNFFNKNRKSAPQAGKKSSGSYKKLSIPGDSKATTEKSSNPINSAQYIQSLMEKYQKGLEEGTNRSKESSKDNYTGIKTKVSGDDLGDKAPKSSELYSNTDFYAKVAKKAEPKTHHHLSRSKTDDTLLKDFYQNKPKTLLKASPTKVSSNQPASARTIALSPTNPRKDKLGHRFGSNEGLSPRLFNTSTNKLITQLSSENCKSLAENLPEDRFYSTSGNNGNYKSVKIEKIFAYKRTEMKPPMKNSAQKSEASNNLSTNMRRLTAAHTYSGASSVEKNDLNSVPVSPTKKFDLKLNLNRLNQMPGRHQKEASTENSYGFWTSRSARLGPDEESKHLKQSGGPVDNKNDSSKKEYLLKKNYEPYLDTKKKTKTSKKGGSFTNRGPTHGLKAREGEVSRNPTLLKSAAHESDLHHMYTDLHEVNSAGRANILRNSDTRLDLNSARNDSHRQGKK